MFASSTEMAMMSTADDYLPELTPDEIMKNISHDLKFKEVNVLDLPVT